MTTKSIARKAPAWNGTKDKLDLSTGLGVTCGFRLADVKRFFQTHKLRVRSILQEGVARNVPGRLRNRQTLIRPGEPKTT